METDGPDVLKGTPTSVVMNCLEASDKVSSCLGCPDCWTTADKLDSKGCSEIPKAYLKDAYTDEMADSDVSVSVIVGSAGLDSVNTTNEVVTNVAKNG